MRITNINGLSQTKCECKSWIKHWKKYSGDEVDVCQVVDCTRTDVVGAHVQKDQSNDTNWYIAPLCKLHYMSKTSLDIIEGTPLISANKAETCEK